MTPELCLTLAADLSDVVGDRRLLSPGVGPASEAIFLLVDEAGAPVQRGRAEQSPRSSPRPNMAELVVHDGQRVARRAPLRELPAAHDFLQPLPGGEILIVGAWCRRFPDGSVERNARVYAADGALRRAFVLGDGIGDVQATAAGALWVGYVEEGIFGWDEEMAAAGLARFDAHGTKLWEYQPPAGFDSIDHCDALNTSEDVAWACYGESLVRIGPDGRVRGLVRGTTAFALDGRRVLLAGGYGVLAFAGYGADRGRAMVAELGQECLESANECRLVLPSGEPLGETAVVGLGPTLHIFAGARWYQADVRNLQ